MLQSLERELGGGHWEAPARSLLLLEGRLTFGLGWRRANARSCRKHAVRRRSDSHHICEKRELECFSDGLHEYCLIFFISPPTLRRFDA